MNTNQSRNRRRLRTTVLLPLSTSKFATSLLYPFHRPILPTCASVVRVPMLILSSAPPAPSTPRRFSPETWRVSPPAPWFMSSAGSEIPGSACIVHPDSVRLKRGGESGPPPGDDEAGDQGSALATELSHERPIKDAVLYSRGVPIEMAQ